VTGTLLAIDGDSLAHRAYHGLPKSIRLNALVGFSNFLLRLWDSEQPESVLVGWDSPRDADLPPRSAARLPVWPRVRGLRSSSSSRCSPASSSRSGSRSERQAVTKRTTSSPPRRAPGPARCSSRRRIATPYQLVDDRVSILQPVKGVSELARIGPAEVRERYGVEPHQVPDFIALRGEPVGQDPGRARGRPKKAADVLKQHGSLAQALADGRFPQLAEELLALPEHRHDGRRRAASGTQAHAATGRAPPPTRNELGLGGLATKARRTRLGARDLSALDRPGDVCAQARVRLVRRDEARGSPGRRVAERRPHELRGRPVLV